MSHVFLILIILYLTSQARLFLPDIKNQQEMLKRCFVWRKKTELNYEFQVSASRSCSWKAVQFFPDISSSTTCVYNLCVLHINAEKVFCRGIVLQESCYQCWPPKQEIRSESRWSTSWCGSNVLTFDRSRERIIYYGELGSPRTCKNCFYSL